MTARIVTLLTDFGWSDPWLAEVKAALHSQWARWPGQLPHPVVIDLAHDLPAGDVAAGAWFLERVWPRFPAGTVHVAVVDPGVGSARPAVAASRDGHFFVGPGNGLLAFLEDQVEKPEVVLLDNSLYHGPGPVSSTFHGRDIFAPAAAHLAMGVSLGQIGSPGGGELLGRLPGKNRNGDAYHICWVDRFGNAITDLPRESDPGQRLQTGAQFTVAGHRVHGPLDHYGQAEAGRVFWYWGSGGTLEIAGNGFSASQKLGLRPGLALVVPDM